MRFFFIGLLSLCANLSALDGFTKTWTLGGDLQVQFESSTNFTYTEQDAIQLAAHLPGCQEADVSKPTLRITHTFTDDVQLSQKEGSVIIQAPWQHTLPADFVHLLYGACRLEWLKQKVFAVHAACIGTDETGYSLLIGPPGSGKTSLTLYCAMHGYKVFSGDKTLLRFTDDGTLEAISGTRTITIRSEDRARWLDVPKVQEYPFADRLAFQLPPNLYADTASVPIKQIFLISVNNGVQIRSELTPLSALHTLYPFFLDKQREDILVAGDKAVFDGAVSKKCKTQLATNLSQALKTIPVVQLKATIKQMAAQIAPKKILFGICGIGNGHYNRQLPVLTHLLEEGHRIMVFTYGEGLVFFNERFPKHPRLTVVPVANPYFVGAINGLDYEATALSEKNKVDFSYINSLAMHQASKEFGRPDLVISDYEMVAAQYAYAKSAPLVTLDQQSKYLVGDFPPQLHDTSYQDEVERLHLFFPKADKRIAVSFFTVKPLQQSEDDVLVLPPMIRPEISAAIDTPKSSTPSFLVYVTAQQLGVQPVDDWIHTIQKVVPKQFEVHIFLPKRLTLPAHVDHIHFYHHGDTRFDPLFIASHAVISTAGHTLLSEAMYLKKPVYALPLPLYEQQLNGHIIAEGGFGICEENLSSEGLSTFLANLERYADNIRNDQQLLFKESGNARILEIITQLLQEPK